MPDVTYTICPRDHRFVPDQTAIESCMARIRATIEIPRFWGGSPDLQQAYLEQCKAAGRAAVLPKELFWELSDHPVFIDCGECLESITCPECGAPIEESRWAALMDAAYKKTRFVDIAITLPCCGMPSTLNDLVYDMPMRIASFSITMWNPVTHLTDEEIAELADEHLKAPGGCVLVYAQI